MRTHLFSFATLRNPQIASPIERERFFIHLTPEAMERTHYFTELRSDTFTGLKFEIRRRSGDFETVMTLDDLKSTHSGLLALYRAFRSEEFRASFSDFHQVMEELRPTPLNAIRAARLWDHLAHYLWVDPQEHEVEAITAIFVADKFLSGFREIRASDEPLTDEQERDLRRLSNARVVIPIPIDNRVPESTGPRFSAQQRTLLEVAHDRLVATIALNDLERARADVAVIFHRAVEESGEQAGTIRTERETELRATLDRLALGDLGTNIMPLVRAAISAPRPKVRMEDIRKRLSATTLAAIDRLKIEAPSVTPVIARLDQRIGELQLQAGEEIETVHEGTYLAFGAEINYQESIPPGGIIVKAKAADAGGFDYYLSHYHTTPERRLLSVAGTVLIDGDASEVTGVRQPVQHPAIQTFKLNDDPIEGAHAEFELRLVRADAADSPQPLAPFQVFDAVAHFDVPEFGGADDFTAQPPPLFGVNKIGVVDFRRVEQELACYVTGAVSHVENIMARQYKEKVSRSLTVHETEDEFTDERGAERQSDTETAEKLEMQSEVSSVLSEERSRSFDVGAGISVNFPANTGSLNTNFNFNYNSSSSRQDSNSEALELAKSITNRIQEKITQKTTARRRSLYRREFEDTNKHGFDNRDGTDHVVGVFRWVDQIIDNRLVNYGRRTVIEFQIPEPAKNFIRAQENSVETENFGKRPPKAPIRLGLRRPIDITRTNYPRFASAYGVTVPEPPAKSITVSRAFSDTPIIPPDQKKDDTSPLFRTAAYNEIEVPDGYVARKANLVGAFIDGLLAIGAPNPFAGGGRLSASIGDSEYTNVFNEGTEIELPDLTGIVPVGLWISGAASCVVNVSVTCELDDRLFSSWRLAAYNAILDAYRSKRAEYDSELEDHEAKQDKIDLNPVFKRQLMERELKRLCIEMITRPFNVDVTANHYGPAAQDELFQPLKLSPLLDKHAALVKFFEQVFDWHLMAYIFYPYFYSPEGTWAVKLGMEGKDSIFASFLTSGMGRAVVPIKKGFEEAAMYYLQTGEIWFGTGFVLDVKNDLYLSIADEMMTQNEEFTIEQTWQSKLPTSLTILQSRSAALAEEGLPCHDEANKIGVGTSALNPAVRAPVEPLP